MAECLICEGDFMVDGTNEHRIVTVRMDRLDKGDRFGVCSTCRAKVEAYDTAKRAVEAAQKRIAELEAKLAEQAADAELGRMVRKLPHGLALWSSADAWRVADMESVYTRGSGATPLEALKAAGLVDR